MANLGKVRASGEHLEADVVALHGGEAAWPRPGAYETDASFPRTQCTVRNRRAAKANPWMANLGKVRASGEPLDGLAVPLSGSLGWPASRRLSIHSALPRCRL